LACTFVNPCFGREPKARVVTIGERKKLLLDFILFYFYFYFILANGFNPMGGNFFLN